MKYPILCKIDCDTVTPRTRINRFIAKSFAVNTRKTSDPLTNRLRNACEAATFPRIQPVPFGGIVCRKSHPTKGPAAMPHSFNLLSRPAIPETGRFSHETFDAFQNRLRVGDVPQGSRISIPWTKPATNHTQRKVPLECLIHFISSSIYPARRYPSKYPIH